MTESGPSQAIGLSNDIAYWNARYKNGYSSGDGSYGECLAKKLKALEILENVNSVLEIGCGDFNFGKHLMFQLKLPMDAYTGYDISEVVIDRNKKFYPNSNWKLLTTFPAQGADLILCTDVLFHVTDDQEYGQLLDNLKKLWTTGKYLAVTSYEEEQTNVSQHLRIRKFDPSFFGTPIVREIVEEPGSLYLYVFKNDKPIAG